MDRNVNYTNVCNVYCKFCAFYRTEKDTDAYIISLAGDGPKIEETLALGGTQILMQGGHHPKLTKQWYLDLLSHIKAKFPQINIHGFSPSEFVHFREVFNEPLEKIISDFKAAGLGSIPGGGGEILVDRVRQRMSPLKAMSNDWLEVMDIAHRLGLYSSATMMFGHVETVEDRIEHLERLRAQQEKSQKRKAESQSRQAENGRPPLYRLHRLDLPGRAYPAERAHRGRPRIPAHPGPGRIYLDNFENVQSSWVTQGQEIGAGGPQIRRQRPRQHHDRRKCRLPGRHHLPHDRPRHAPAHPELGYEPHQRDNWYRLVN